MSKREINQKYVLIPKRKLNALGKKCPFDPDLETSVLELSMNCLNNIKWKRNP